MTTMMTTTTINNKNTSRTTSTANIYPTPRVFYIARVVWKKPESHIIEDDDNETLIVIRVSDHLLPDSIHRRLHRRPHFVPVAKVLLALIG